tara:strand:- start:40 stop:603 length:564 start_codon:yes stop_codon:yes gene_type:complete
MSNFTDFFPAAGGGGGSMPKYQDFTSSGTFTPTQALIDAGGRVSYFVVAGGQQGGGTTTPSSGGSGGEVEYGYMTLNSTTGCLVTIGAGGASASAAGSNSSAIFSSAGGTDVTASGGTGLATGRNFGAQWHSGYGFSAAFSGVGNYGKGGGEQYFGGGVNFPLPNSGGGSKQGSQAGSGFVRITWFE